MGARVWGQRRGLGEGEGWGEVGCEGEGEGGEGGVWALSPFANSWIFVSSALSSISSTTSLIKSVISVGGVVESQLISVTRAPDWNLLSSSLKFCGTSTGSEWACSGAHPPNARDEGMLWAVQWSLPCVG